MPPPRLVTPPVVIPDRPLPPLASPPGLNDPAVHVDFVVAQGLLSVVLENPSAVAAFRVAVKFDVPFKGLGGRANIPDLELFKSVPFLAPRRQIEAFVDSLDAYFRRNEPTSLVATVFYFDEAGKAFRRTIAHNLAIYRDLPRVLPPLPNFR